MYPRLNEEDREPFRLPGDGAFSRAESCDLECPCLARLVLRKLFNCANRSPTLLSGSIACVSVRESLRFYLASWYLAATQSRVISPALDNLSIGKGGKRRQDPLLGCSHTENSYHQSCRPTYSCAKTLRSASPKHQPVSFEQTLLGKKIFLV